ncbi:MAG TPA: FAD-binding protein, partial [Anaerolineae bacterium]
MSVDTRHLATDVLVVGAGFAGCRAAIAAHDAGAAVLMVSGGPFPATGSSFHLMRLGWGRGYTAGLGRSGPGDTPDAHLAAILAAGQGLVDLRLARVLVDEAPARFRELEGWGVRFT